MKLHTLAATIALGLAVCGGQALAQSSDNMTSDAQAQKGPANAAIKSPHTNRSDTPVAGHNSFTHAQARGHIKKAGYSHVTHLVKGKDGVWRADAMQDGKSVRVTLDYQGNVNPE
jgi:hypothetical protein